jgi:CheY-like chemotaxis protein
MTDTTTEKKKRVLVVDDTELFLIAMQEMLEREEFEVLTAKDGLEAVQTIKHEMPNLDLVLLDLLLPHLTGFEVLKQIREGKLGKDLPVLVITGVFKKAQQINQLKKLGATGYMTKDLKAEEIVRRVKTTLGIGLPPGAQTPVRPGPEPMAPVEKLEPGAFLAQSQVFSGIDQEQTGKVEKIIDEVTFGKDEIIFSDGEEGDSFYIIVDGSVRIVKTGEARDDEILAILEPGTSFGEMALVEKETRSATVIANDPSTLLRIRKDDFEKLLRGDRDLSLTVYKNFVQMLSARLRKTSESLTFSRSLLEELRKK